MDREDRQKSCEQPSTSNAPRAVESGADANLPSTSHEQKQANNNNKGRNRSDNPENQVDTANQGSTAAKKPPKYYFRLPESDSSSDDRFSSTTETVSGPSARNSGRIEATGESEELNITLGSNQRGESNASGSDNANNGNSRFNCPDCNEGFENFRELEDHRSHLHISEYDIQPINIPRERFSLAPLDVSHLHFEVRSDGSFAVSKRRP